MMQNIYIDRMFVAPSDTEMTPDLLSQYIRKHKTLLERYTKLKNQYNSNPPILSQTNKAAYKPDNRLVVNYAKYIVDTLNGFFIGIPIKLSHDNQAVDDYLEFVDQYNDQDDNNAELSKLCSIYGNAYELIFADESGQAGLTYLSPEEAFVIYDDSIVRRPLFGVRYYKDPDNVERGSFSTADKIQYFHDDGGYQFDDEVPHYFGDIPLIEYMENEERSGAFEGVETLINAHNKALSEKANDVDYYADAYMKIIGPTLDENTLNTLRDNRIINLACNDPSQVTVDFMQKPDADGTQENLVERLENLIFQISMVANINDKDFGNASGISLKYKLQSMFNLAKTKERKFVSGMNRRYKMLAHFPGSKMGEDDWMGIHYQFTRNIPSNLLEESQIAGNLAGITSEETQLKVLSCVDNVKEEIQKKQEEAQSSVESFKRTDVTENAVEKQS